MSAKLKLTVWIAAMMLLLSVITLAFVIWVDETGLVDDPAERLVKTVLDNEKNFEYERGAIDWDEVYLCDHQSGGDLHCGQYQREVLRTGRAAG